MNNKNVNALIAREFSGFTCTRSLTMNSKFSIPHEAAESRRLFRHNPVSRGTSQPIRKSEFVQLTCKYTTGKIYTKLHPGLEWRIFEGLNGGGGGGLRVGCRLKLHYFVGCRLKFSIFPRFVGSQ